MATKKLEGAELAKESGYLCSGCADDLGGKWPKDHRASFHGAACPICKRKAMLASWDDWNWPYSKLNETANKMREI